MRRLLLCLSGAVMFTLAFDPAAFAQQASRDVANVAVVEHENGMVSAQLDESFEETMMAMPQADGTFKLVCAHGLAKGAAHAPNVKISSAQLAQAARVARQVKAAKAAMKTAPAKTVKTAKSAPPAAVRPEEKE